MPSGGRPYPRQQADTNRLKKDIDRDERMMLERPGEAARVDSLNRTRGASVDTSRIERELTGHYNSRRAAPAEKILAKEDTLDRARRGEIPAHSSKPRRKPVKMKKRGRNNALAKARDEAGRDAFRAMHGRSK